MFANGSDTAYIAEYFFISHQNIMARINKAAIIANANRSSKVCCCRVSKPDIDAPVVNVYKEVFNNLVINGETYKLTATINRDDFRVGDAGNTDYSQANRVTWDQDGNIRLKVANANNIADPFFWKVNYTFSPTLSFDPEFLPPLPLTAKLKSNAVNGQNPVGPAQGSTGGGIVSSTTTETYFATHIILPGNEAVHSPIRAQDEVNKIVIQIPGVGEWSLLFDFNVVWL